MANNTAMKKALKAAQRKAVVSAKRKTEVAAATPTARIRQAAREPILQCLVSEGLFKNGIGTVTLVRGVSREEQHIAVFMIDTYCLGVKDSHYRVAGRQQTETILEATHLADATCSIAPPEARKLLRDVTAWAAFNGFAATEGYASLERLFGDIVPSATDYTARFGLAGKVFYIPGPTESRADVRRRTRLVQARFGQAAIGSIFDSDDDAPDDGDDDDGVDAECEPEDDEVRVIA